jgi:uncharacterized membrane protein YdjX (TVP38/TMEM64 family)
LNRTPHILRLIVLATIVTMAVVAVVLIMGDERGRQLLSKQEIHALGDDVRAFVATHTIVAPAIFAAVYLVFSFLALPVWPLQVLAGYGFGLFGGIAAALLSATMSATVVRVVSHWLGHEWLRKAEQHSAKIRKLDEKLGRHGLFVVMAVRLMHITPFGLSNYVFGITRIRASDVALGTLLGASPAISFYVALGADRALLVNWRFWTSVGIVNLILLVPLVWRHLHMRRVERIRMRAGGQTADANADAVTDRVRSRP